LQDSDRGQTDSTTGTQVVEWEERMSVAKEANRACVLVIACGVLVVGVLAFAQMFPQQARETVKMLDYQYARCEQCGGVWRLPKWYLWAQGPECVYCDAVCEWHSGDTTADRLNREIFWTKDRYVDPGPEGGQTPDARQIAVSPTLNRRAASKASSG
jgi:hypothetical protein